jgi:chromosome segregation ATPase
LGRAELEKEELQKEIDKLKREVRRAERENKYPDVTLAVRQRQIEGLVSIVDDKDDKNDDLRAKNTRLSKEASAAKREKEAAENEILLLKRAKNDLESRVRRLETRSLEEAGFVVNIVLSSSLCVTVLMAKFGLQPHS